MKEIKFPYIKYLVTPPTIKPVQYVYRPVIPINLSLGKRQVTFDGLVDSGADESTFPAWIAKTLGYDVYKGKEKRLSYYRGVTKVSPSIRAGTILVMAITLKERS